MEVRQWYFEVLERTELDIFWVGGSGGYFKLYDVTARAIKSVSADICGWSGNGRKCMDSAAIEFVGSRKIPLDFLINAQLWSVKRDWI